MNMAGFLFTAVFSKATTASKAFSYSSGVKCARLCDSTPLVD